MIAVAVLVIVLAAPLIGGAIAGAIAIHRAGENMED